jgi:transposase
LKKNEKRKRENENIQKIELEWSKHSLKVHSVPDYLDNLKIQLKNWNEYSEFYRSKKMIRLSFSNHIKKQKLIQEVERHMCPNKDTIIANGSANFAKSRPGLSATPVAKIMKKISESKRVALTPEQYTTCRCSMCRHTTDKMNDLYGNEKYKDKNGVMRFQKIHGLKQCTHCSRLWSRDLNAAINIGNAFVQLNKYGTRPDYLKPMMSSDLSTQGCDVQMQLCQTEAIPQSYPCEMGKY